MKETANDLVVRVFDLCSCGSGKDGRLIFNVLEICEIEIAKRTPEQSMYFNPGYELAAKLLDDKGFIGHGSGIGFPWLEKKGEIFLRRLRKIDAAEEPSKRI